MVKKILKLVFGILLSSFAITNVIHSGLGAFPITACNMAVANFLNVSMGTGAVIVEMIILFLAIWLGEGLSATGIINATIGSLLVDVWNPILPYHPLMIFGVFLLPIAWYMTGSLGWGDTNTNLLMSGLVKKFNKSNGFIRTVLEVVFMVIGFIGSDLVTPLTIILSFGFGYAMQFEWKLLKYEPTKVKQSYLIKGKERNLVKEGK